MRKHLLFVALLMTGICMLPSCGSRPKPNHIEQVTLKKDNVDSSAVIKMGISENYNKSYTEEINYKSAISEPQPIELTAVFRLDTSATLKGDTALKLVSVDDSNVSVSVYQNRRTNELTAKITSKGKKPRNVPFSELQIKRTFNEQSSKVDTTSTATHVIKAKVDSTSNTTTPPQEQTFKTQDWLIAGGLLIALGILAFFIFKPKTK